MRLCSSSTNRIRSGSAASALTSRRTRSSYCPRNAVPASSATWSSATTRASFSAGGTSPAATRWASPSTMAVLPTPARPMSAGLFLFWRSRMSTTRAISASRQRTGSRSPRRAWAVRSTPTRSSTSPESNKPSNGSTMSPAPEEASVPIEDGVPRDERQRRPHGEEYPEGHETLLLEEQQRHVHQAAEHRGGEHGEERPLPADEAADHRHHLDVAAAHRFLFQDPASREPHGEKHPEPDPGSQDCLEEPVHAPPQGQGQAEAEPDPVVFVGDEVVARVGHGDAEQDGAEDGRGDEMQRRAIGQQRSEPQHADERFDDGVLRGDRLPAPPALAVQQQPGRHGDVVAPRDPPVAVGAARRRAEQRAVFLVLFGEPEDADVEEAAEAEPQEGGADGEERVSEHAAPRGAGYPPRPRR